jgi:hypothetical protein
VCVFEEHAALPWPVWWLVLLQAVAQQAAAFYWLASKPLASIGNIDQQQQRQLMMMAGTPVFDQV